MVAYFEPHNANWLTTLLWRRPQEEDTPLAPDATQQGGQHPPYKTLHGKEKIHSLGPIAEGEGKPMGTQWGRGGNKVSLKGEGVMSVKKEVPINMRIQGFLVALGRKTLVADGALLPERR